MALLEVLIPTYNRPNELAKCLRSLENSIKNLSHVDRSKLVITIRNNSTEYFEQYKNLIDTYNPIFKNFNISSFDYQFTGFNIGTVNNCVGGILNSKSDYIWVLPDDDIARFDALSISIPLIEKYKPDFISGGCLDKSTIEYPSNEIGEDNKLPNKILDVIYDRSKVLLFLSKNVVQLQEYIYNVQLVKNFLSNDKHVHLLNDMWPGLFGIFSLQSEKSFVRLEKSLGIFRKGDPRSEWRHLWYKYALIDWPIISEKLFKIGLLNKVEAKASKAVFRVWFPKLSYRPDILLGINRKSSVNPFLLIKYHGYHFFIAVLKSPFLTFKEIFKRLKKYLK
jgi:glycosyltransferase involved in cell wall biosynthesis